MGFDENIITTWSTTMGAMQESFKKKGLNSVSYKFFVHPKTAFEMNVPVV